MSERSRRSLLVHGWVGLALCLVVAGCQIQVNFIDPNASKPAPQPAPPVQVAQQPIIQTSALARKACR